MTQATQGIIKTFAMTVKELGKDSNGFKATCDIPGLGKFPVDLNRIPEQDYKLLEVGKAYNVLLERGSLKQHEPPYDGKMDWMFFQNWRGFAVATVPDQTHEPSGGVDKARQVYREQDPTRSSIERQKALDIAERLYWNWWDRIGSKQPNQLSTLWDHGKLIKVVAASLAAFLITGKPKEEGQTDSRRQVDESPLPQTAFTRLEKAGRPGGDARPGA